jgi:hypothetical protein
MPAPAILRPAAAAVGLGLRAERGVRRRVGSGVGDLAERAIGRALRGPLVDVVAQDLVRYRVVERVSQTMLAAGTVERVLDNADTAGVPQRVAERLLADGIAEQVAIRLLAGPELERLVQLVVASEPLHEAIADALASPGAEHLVGTALESPGFARMLTQIVESRAVDDTVARVVDETAERLPERQALWKLVDVIAASPAVTEAIAQQSAGFADHVAGAVRERSAHADAKLERAAWSLLRRRPRDQSVEGAPSTTGAT